MGGGSRLGKTSAQGFASEVDLMSNESSFDFGRDEADDTKLFSRLQEEDLQQKRKELHEEAYLQRGREGETVTKYFRNDKS